MSQLVFLQLSETSVGDTDFLLSPVASINDTGYTGFRRKFGPNSETQQSNLSKFQNFFSKLINITKVEAALSEMPEIFGESPRWLLIGDLAPATQRQAINSELRSFILIIDSEREISLGIGRNADVRPIKNNSAYVTSSTLRGLGLKEGDPAIVNIDLMNIITQQGLIQTTKGTTNMTSEQIQIQATQNLITNELNTLLANQFGGQQILLQQFNTTELKNLFEILNETAQFYQQQNLQNFENDFFTLVDFVLSNNEQVPIIGQTSNLRNFIMSFNGTNLTNGIIQASSLINQLPDNTLFSLDNVTQDLAQYVVQSLNITIDIKIEQSLDSVHGKWAEGLGNVVALDYHNITNIITEAFSRGLENIIQDVIIQDNNIQAQLAQLFVVPTLEYIRQLEFNLTDYALSSSFVMNDRVKVYSSSSGIKTNVITTTNNFFTKIGILSPQTFQIPLANSISQFFLVKNFLDTLVVSATFLLLMLSVLLIYSLMIGDVEEKTYEYGMLRALGFGKIWLVVLLTIQALMFALPGLALGMVSAYLLNALVGYFIFGNTSLISSYQLHYSAIALGISLGFFIPLVSNILPIMRALSKTLRDSLDLYHRTINEVLVQVIRLEKMGISLEQSLTAFLLLFMGFICYYLAPQAFIFQNIALFLAIINITLIIMIIGLTLIANLIQQPIEKAFVKLLLCIFRRDRILQPIILKNMEGHNRRNSKTTLMYTLALSFLIFSGTGFTLQGHVISDMLKSTFGGDITIFAPANDNSGLDEQNIKDYLFQQNKINPGLLRGYAFTTYSLENFPGMTKTLIYPLSNFPQRKTSIIGVEETLLYSINTDYYMPNTYDQTISYPKLPDGQLDGIHGLYTREGNIDLPRNSDVFLILSNAQDRKTFMDTMTMAEQYRGDGQNIYNLLLFIRKIDREINIVLPYGLKYEISMDVKTPAMIQQGNTLFRVKVRHMAKKIPGFLFSGYRYIAFNGESLVSMQDFSYIIETCYNGSLNKNEFNDPQVKLFFEQIPVGNSYNLPKEQLFIKFAKTTTNDERTDFANGLRNYFRNEQTLLIDVVSLVNTANDSFYYINLFYIIVAIVATVLSFFLILVSFISNVRENSWEFGVLRAIGLDKTQITRVYIYESLSLIITSGLIGMIVGISVAAALTAQMIIFTELPFVFLFPTAMFLIIFIGGFITAIGGSYFAVREIRDKSISTILKGLL